MTAPPADDQPTNLRFKISELQREFKDLNEMIQEPSNVTGSRKVEIAKFARLFALIDIRNEDLFGVSIITLKLQISIIQKIFDDIFEIIDETSRISGPRKFKFAEFGMNLNRIDVQTNSDDRFYFLHQLSMHAWESVIKFYQQLLCFNFSTTSKIYPLHEKLVLFMYSGLPSKNTPTTVDELREYLAKERATNGEIMTEDISRNIPVLVDNRLACPDISGEMNEDSFLTFGVAD